MQARTKEQLGIMALVSGKLSSTHPHISAATRDSIVWGFENKAGPRPREGIISSTLCSSDHIALHAEKTPTNWMEVRGNHQVSRTEDLALQGEAAKPGLVQLPWSFMS